MSKKAIKAEMEYLKYAPELGELTEEERAFAIKFYSEYHGGQAGQEGGLLTTREQIKEANRNHNSLYRDAFNVSVNLGKNVQLEPDQLEVLEEASDELDFESAFSQGGYELASQVVTHQALRDLETTMDKQTVLVRFYVKMRRVDKLRTTEKRKANK